MVIVNPFARFRLRVAVYVPPSYGRGGLPPLAPLGVPPVPPVGAGADAPGVLISIFVVLVRCNPPPNTNQPMTARRIRTTMAHTHPEPDPVVGVC